MKNAINWFIACSVVLNCYYLGVWMYVVNIVDTQPARVDQFLTFLPFNLSVGQVTAGLFLLSLLSVILLVRIKAPDLWKWMLPIQLVFALGYLWSYL